jgi:hypothetical protein
MKDTKTTSQNDVNKNPSEETTDSLVENNTNISYCSLNEEITAGPVKTDSDEDTQFLNNTRENNKQSQSKNEKKNIKDEALHEDEDEDEDIQDTEDDTEDDTENDTEDDNSSIWVVTFNDRPVYYVDCIEKAKNSAWNAAHSFIINEKRYYNTTIRSVRISPTSLQLVGKYDFYVVSYDRIFCTIKWFKVARRDT